MNPEAHLKETRQSKSASILSVRDLKVSFRTDAGLVRAVNGVSFDVKSGETLAIVGESGSGKSVTSLALMQLLPQRIAEVERGTAIFGGKDLLQLSETQMRRVRGNDIAMIFQEPMTSLDPVMTVGRQIAEAIMVHQGLSRREARDAAIEALRSVRVPEPLLQQSNRIAGCLEASRPVRRSLDGGDRVGFSVAQLPKCASRSLHFCAVRECVPFVADQVG